MGLYTFPSDKHGTLATECFSSVSRVCALLTLHLHLAMNSLQSRNLRFEAVDEESCFEFFHTTFREGGLLATLWAREWLVGGYPEGQLEDALLAIVVKAREDLGVCVVLLAYSTSNLLFQLLQTLPLMYNTFSHDGYQQSIAIYYFQNKVSPLQDFKCKRCGTAHKIMIFIGSCVP